MSLFSKKQSQFELFPGSREKASEKEPSVFNFKDLTVSLENAIVLCIIFLMTMVLFFAFGVEKGKKIARVRTEATDTVEAKNEEKTTETIAIQVDPKEVEAVSEVKPSQTEEAKPQVLEIPLDKEQILKNIYTIQVASFKLKKHAQAEAKKLENIGHETFVIPKGEYTIVCVGKFQLRDEAKRFSERLKKKYNDCLVRRL